MGELYDRLIIGLIVVPDLCFCSEVIVLYRPCHILVYDDLIVCLKHLCSDNQPLSHACKEVFCDLELKPVDNGVDMKLAKENNSGFGKMIKHSTITSFRTASIKEPVGRFVNHARSPFSCVMPMPSFPTLIPPMPLSILL